MRVYRTLARIFAIPALAVLLAAGFGVATLQSGSASSVPNTGIGVAGWNDFLAQASNKGSYSVVIGDPSQASAMASYPGRTLVYFAGPDVNSSFDVGVPWSRANANGWLLRDSSGNLLVNQGYPSNNIGDVGSTGYQQAWLSNVLGFLSAHPGIDGVHIDDVEIDIKDLTGVEAAKYPTQQAWAAAQLSFIAAVGPALKAQGYYVDLNATAFVAGDSGSDDGSLYASWYRQLGPYVSGLSQEYYDETADGSNTLRTTGGDWTQNWDGWQQLIAVTQSMGVDFVACMHGAVGDTRSMTYGKASFLMEWNGGGGAFIYVTPDNSDPWNQAWTTDIGQPAAVKQQVGVGWMRQYTGVSRSSTRARRVHRPSSSAGATSTLRVSP